MRGAISRYEVRVGTHQIEFLRITMHYQHDIKNSETFALASFQEMKLNAVAYNPVNFSVWYNFHARVNPELVSRIKELNANQDRITDDQSAALFEEFVSGEVLSKSRRISEKLEHIASKLPVTLSKQVRHQATMLGRWRPCRKIYRRRTRLVRLTISSVKY